MKNGKRTITFLMKAVLISALITAFFAFIEQSKAQPLTVLDVYSGLPESIGQTITVQGFYVSPDHPVLGLSEEMFQIRLQPSPHSYIELVGSLPSSPYSWVTVTGIIDTLARPYPVLGVTYVGRLNVISSVIGPRSENPLWQTQPHGRKRGSIETPQIQETDELITFAMLICSDNERADFWNDMVNFWDYISGLGIDPDDIYAFYGDGDSENPAQIPDEALRPATHDEIESAFEELQDRIATESAAGNDTKLIKMVTDHGSGYHTGSSDPFGPQPDSDGWGGGHVDQNGDETDSIPESQMKFDFSGGPALGKTFWYDLDGDGSDDFRVHNDSLLGLIAEAWNGTDWVFAGWDMDDDLDIDGDDGGIDLNGDGDYRDAFAWDEDLVFSEDGSYVLDDEWAAWQDSLGNAGLDTLLELIDCCFSGGFLRDEQLVLPTILFVQKGMACEEGEYSEGVGTPPRGAYAGPFVDELRNGGSWPDAHDAARESADTLQTPQWWEWQPPIVDLEMTPFGMPIIIPPLGGSFSYNIAAANGEISPLTFDVWIMVTLPNGAPFGPVLGPVNLTLPGNGSINRNRTQIVPAGAPPGNYNYVGYAGDYPTEIWASDSFPFTKMGAEDPRAEHRYWAEGWTVEGEPLESPLTQTNKPLPIGFSFHAAHPNPFNPATVLSYMLPYASKVNLKVYDCAGRLVTDLVNGWREAGVHEVTFDGSGLPSGIYIVQLEAATFRASQKLVLMK